MIKFAHTVYSSYRSLGPSVFRAIEADWAFWRTLIAVVLAAQALGAFSMALTLMFLHGDGSFFVYALSVGAPWELKWSAISARFSTFAFSVIPTAVLADWFDLSPIAIARLNGVVFNLLPALQFAIALCLLRSNERHLAIFPLVTTIFGLWLGFGFPSEILLAPGFLWIAMFSARRMPAVSFSLIFFASFVCLVFSHELAVPSAFIAAGYGMFQLRRVRKPQHKYLALSAVFISVLLTLFVYLRVQSTGGMEGSVNQAIYALDPRKVLSNPSAWIVLTVLLCVAGLQLSGLIGTGRRSVLITAVTSFALPLFALVIFPDLNFEDGRYDMRTIIGGLMCLSAATFFIWTNEAETFSELSKSSHRETFHFGSSLKIAATGAAGATVGCFLGFANMWMNGNAIVTQLARQEPNAARTHFVSFDELNTVLSQRDTFAVRQLSFPWALPYRASVLANGERPSIVIYDSYYDYAKLVCKDFKHIDGKQNRLSALATNDLEQFACTFDVKNHEPTRVRQFLNSIQELLN